jgi:hypothetical protein
MFSRWIVTNITSASVTTFLALLAGIISWSAYCTRSKFPSRNSMEHVAVMTMSQIARRLFSTVRIKGGNFRPSLYSFVANHERSSAQQSPGSVCAPNSYWLRVPSRPDLAPRLPTECIPDNTSTHSCYTLTLWSLTFSNWVFCNYRPCMVLTVNSDFSLNRVKQLI